MPRQQCSGKTGRVLAVLFTGVLMGALDIAIVGPALPAIQLEYALDGRAMSWVFNVYILFHLLGAPLMAKPSDRYGRRRVYLADITLFACGSVFVAAAPDLLSVALKPAYRKPSPDPILEAS
jgi:MFS family permease